MSILDMNSRMAMAEKLSVPQLQEAIQSGSLPAYIGIPLIEQKNKEKSQMVAAQGGQQEPPSVTSRVLQEAQQPAPQDQGITQLPSNLPMMGAEQGMADGGIVAFAEAGQVQTPQEPIPLSTYGNMPLMSPEAQARFAKQEQRLEELSGRNESAYSDAKNMAIFQAGIGMMGGQSSNPFANATAGIMPALTGYQAAVKDLKKEERDALTKLMELGLSKDKFMQEAQKMGIEVDKANKAFESSRLSDTSRIAAANIAASNKQPRAMTEAELKELQIQNEQKVLEDGGMPRPQARIQAQRNVARYTKDENAVTNPILKQQFIEKRATQLEAEGLPPDQAYTQAWKEATAEERPVAPNAVVANAVSARTAKDPEIQRLELQLFQNRNNPEKVLEINEKIDARNAAIAKMVEGVIYPGRGLGGTGNTRTGPKEDPLGLFK